MYEAGIRLCVDPHDPGIVTRQTPAFYGIFLGHQNRLCIIELQIRRTEMDDDPQMHADGHFDTVAPQQVEKALRIADPRHGMYRSAGKLGKRHRTGRRAARTTRLVQLRRAFPLFALPVDDHDISAIQPRPRFRNSPAGSKIRCRAARTVNTAISRSRASHSAAVRRRRSMFTSVWASRASSPPPDDLAPHIGQPVLAASITASSPTVAGSLSVTHLLWHNGALSTVAARHNARSPALPV